MMDAQVMAKAARLIGGRMTKGYHIQPREGHRPHISVDLRTGDEHIANLYPSGPKSFRIEWGLALATERKELQQIVDSLDL